MKPLGVSQAPAMSLQTSHQSQRTLEMYRHETRQTSNHRMVFPTKSGVWICAGEHVSKKPCFEISGFVSAHLNGNQAAPNMVVDQPSKVDQAPTIPGNVSIDDRSLYQGMLKCHQASSEHIATTLSMTSAAQLSSRSVDVDQAYRNDERVNHRS